ncbi:MAG: PEP-CTERM sorting domain-containing protein [Phycisphaerae bacterium]|nr:PEP-CTERM sorting domain-containing protein [Phycisphaerae bacterium]
MHSIRAGLAAAVLVLLVVTPAGAGIITTEHFTDADFAALVLEDDIAFVAEGRIGNSALDGDHEFDLGPSTAAPYATDQFVWPGETPVQFALTYDEILNRVSFTVGGHTLSYTPQETFTDLFIRTRAVNDDTSIVIDDLVLDGAPIIDTSSAFGVGTGADVLHIAGADLMDGFTLTGRSTMRWQSRPSRSRLAFQIKAAKAEESPVPEPATLVLVLGGVLGLFARSQRSRI